MPSHHRVNEKSSRELMGSESNVSTPSAIFPFANSAKTISTCICTQLFAAGYQLTNILSDDFVFSFSSRYQLFSGKLHSDSKLFSMATGVVPAADCQRRKSLSLSLCLYLALSATLKWHPNEIDVAKAFNRL